MLKAVISKLDAVRRVLAQINDDFTVQAQQTVKLMLETGCTFQEKRYADYSDEVDYDAYLTYNQFWVR